MTYDRKTSKYVLKIADEFLQIGQEAYDSVKEVFSQEYKEMHQSIVDAVIEMIQFLPNRRPTFQ